MVFYLFASLYAGLSPTIRPSQPLLPSRQSEGLKLFQGHQWQETQPGVFGGRHLKRAAVLRWSGEELVGRAKAIKDEAKNRKTKENSKENQAKQQHSILTFVGKNINCIV